jgi:hypothetical protein
MKKHIYTYKIACLLLAFTAILSCTEGFEDLNKDPNAFNTAEPYNLFAGSVKGTLDLFGGTMNDQMYMMYASYYGGKGGQFGNFFFNENNLDDWWRRAYIDCVKNNQEIIDKFSDNPDYTNRVHIAKVWKSYIYSMLVSTYGGVPFEEASKGINATSYSSEEEIYTEILKLLKEAGEQMDPNGDKLLLDPIFDGNTDLWIKFANSLRLKIALRISEGFPDLAQQHGSEVMQNEDALISSNDENVVMRWGLDQQNWSFNYDRYIFQTVSLDILPLVNFHFMLNLKTYHDPRIFAIVEPSTGPITIDDEVFESGSTTVKIRVQYQLPYFGRALGGNGLVDGWGLNANDNLLNGLRNDRFCRPNEELFMAQDMGFNVITYSEINFIKAEAQLKGWGGSQTAEDYYNAGINASFQQYGAPGARTYREQDGIKWGTSSVGDNGLYSIVTSGISADPIDKIVRQRWLASFNQGHDIWCLQKRTRKLPIIAHFSPDGATGLDWAEIPERMVYPPLSESGFNNAGYTAAVALLANGNSLTSPIKMNKPMTPIDYPSLDVEFSRDFARNFYGPSEDDLIAAGIPYTKL